MKKLSFFLLAVAALSLWSRAEAKAPQKEWDAYKAQFISADGRNIDRQQGKTSTSEGQGYAMLLAEGFDDYPAFQKIWRWTKNNLQVRKNDRLFAWEWGKRPDGQWAAIDLNNATDGDTLIAYALVLAGRKWRNASYISAGRAIAADIRKHLVIERNGMLLVLPGCYGFSSNDALVMNPSYFIWPAYRIFGEVDNKQFWSRVYRDSMKLLGKARFTVFGLPPDWMTVNRAGAPLPTGKRSVYGYSAIRVLLYLAWEKDKTGLSPFKKFIGLYKCLGFIPREVDLANNTFSMDDAPAGFYAVYARAARQLGEPGLGRILEQKAAQKLKLESGSYYSNSLYLLSLMEWK